LAGGRSNLARCCGESWPVDHARHVLDALPPETDVVFTTPSHHCPTSVTMPLERPASASGNGFERMIF